LFVRVVMIGWVEVIAATHGAGCGCGARRPATEGKTTLSRREPVFPDKSPGPAAICRVIHA
jgi:hypothetical protein